MRKAHAEDVVTIEVEMQAFGGGRIRTVVIPVAEGAGQTTESPFWRDLTTDQKFDHIFYYGQNDFQPVPNQCSVSLGDIIRLEGKRYRVDAVGFAEIPELRQRSKAHHLGPTRLGSRGRARHVGGQHWPVNAG